MLVYPYRSFPVLTPCFVTCLGVIIDSELRRIVLLFSLTNKMHPPTCPLHSYRFSTCVSCFPQTRLHVLALHLSDTLLRRLQCILHVAARLIFRSSRLSHVSLETVAMVVCSTENRISAGYTCRQGTFFAIFLRNT